MLDGVEGGVGSTGIGRGLKDTGVRSPERVRGGVGRAFVLVLLTTGDGLLSKDLLALWDERVGKRNLARV